MPLWKCQVSVQIQIFSMASPMTSSKNSSTVTSRQSTPLGKFTLLLLVLAQMFVYQPYCTFAHGVIVQPNRQGSSSSSSSSSSKTRTDTSDLSTASINSVTHPNPYSHGRAGEENAFPDEQMNDERRLFRYLMRNYDTNIRPIKNSSAAINIRLGVTLAQIFDLDEKNQVLTTNIWLDQEWIDEFLTWNATDFGNITKIRVPCQSIWMPDIVLYNNADDYTRGYMCSRAVIEPNGNVFWPPPTKLRSTCEVDVTYFPFDDQTCKMKLGSWIYDGHQVNILNRTENVDLNNYVPNGEWDLISTKLVRNVVFYPCCPEPFPDVTITLVIRRKILYYMYNVILPCIMMSCLTLLVFCLPPESGEKIALGVTVLLAFSVFMLAISEKLPETSESIPLLGFYITMVMGITSVSIVMTVLVLNFHYVSPLNKHELPRWVKRIVMSRQNDWKARLVPTFSDFAKYGKACTEPAEGKHCKHPSPPFPKCTLVNDHKCASGSSTAANTTANTASTAESGVNWFDSGPVLVPPHHRQYQQHQEQQEQQQQPLFSISNNIRPVGQQMTGKARVKKGSNRKGPSFSASKSKWMGQVDRLASSIFSAGSGGNANKANKVHSSERNCATSSSNEAEAVHRKTSVLAPSGNWPPTSTAPVDIGGTREQGQQRAEETHLAGQMGSQPEEANSSAFQECPRLRTVPSLVLPASFESHSGSSGGTYSIYNRGEMYHRSTVLSTITPYFLCAASRASDSSRRAQLNSSLHFRGPNSAKGTRQRMTEPPYIHGAGIDGCEDEEVEVEEEEVANSNEHPYHFGPYGNGNFAPSAGANLRTTTATNRRKEQPPLGSREFTSSPPPSSTQPTSSSQDNDAEIMQMLRYLMLRQETEDDCTRRIHEWRQLSMFIDKILFWIFTVVTLGTSLLFLLIIPFSRRGF